MRDSSVGRKKKHCAHDQEYTGLAMPVRGHVTRWQI